MADSPRSARKSVAVFLSAALLAAAPGPLAVSAAAQALSLPASAGAASEAGAASIGAGRSPGVGLAPLSPAVLSISNAPSAFVGGPVLAAAPAPIAAAASAAALPSAALVAAPASPAVQPISAAAPADSPANASVHALAAGLDAAARPGVDVSRTAAALDSFYSGLAAAPAVFNDLGRDDSSKLKPAEAPSRAPHGASAARPSADPVALNDRLAAKAAKSAAQAGFRQYANSAVAYVVAVAATLMGFASLPAIAALVIVPFAARLLTSHLYSDSTKTMGWILESSNKSGAKTSLLAPVFAAEKEGRRAASASRISAYAVLGFGGLIAYRLFAAHPIGALLIGAAALYSGLKTSGSARTASADQTNLRVALAAKLAEGLPHTDPKDIRGDTAIQKRYWVMLGGKEGSVLHFGDTYSTLRRSGLPAPKAFMTAAMWHVPFARRTWKNAPAEDHGFFDIWIPGLIETQSPSNNRVFSDGGKPGVKRGDLDMDEFDRLFRDFGDHEVLTARDFAVIRAANQRRDAQEGKGSRFSRLIGRYAGKRRADQLLELFADRVVWEAGRWVPAVSREQLLRFYRGGLQYDVIRDRTPGGK